MNNDSGHIDQFFRDKLNESSSETSKDLWTILYRKLFWKRWGLIIISSVLIILLTTGILILNRFEKSNTTILHEIPQMTSDSTIQITGSDSDNSFSLKSLMERNQTDHPEPAKQKNPSTEMNQMQIVLSDIIPSSSKDIMPVNDFRNPSELQTSKKIQYDFFGMTYNPVKIFYIANLQPLRIIQQRQDSMLLMDLIPVVNDKHPVNKKISIGFYLSPSFVDKSLAAQSPNPAYLQLRNDSEKAIGIFGAGADIRFSINNICFSAGFEYAIYGENVKYNFTTDNIDLQNSHFIYDTSWIWIYDSPNIGEAYMVSVDSTWIPVMQKIEMNSWLQNRYRLIEIPVTIGFQKSFNKFSLEAGAGLTAGWLLSCSGNLPDFETKSLLELNASAEFIERNIFSFLLNAGVEYRINDTWSFEVRPQFKRNITSILKTSYGIEQKYTTFGVMTGVRIKL